MKVLWVLKRNWKHPGPIVNVALRNAHSFARAGAETHLCLGAGEPSDTDSEIATFYGLPPHTRLRIHRVRRWPVFGGDSSISIFLHAVRLARAWLATGEEVIVLTRETAFLPYLAMLRTLARGRLRGYYEAHDLYADLAWRRGDGLRTGTQEYRQWALERVFLPRIDGLVCITREQQRLYRDVFPGVQSCAAPLGTEVSDEAFSILPEERRQWRRLVYVGHLHGKKGVKMIWKSAERLAAARVRIAFRGGHESQAIAMRERADKLGIADWIEAVPFQPPEALRRALANEASLGVALLQPTFYNANLTCPVKALDYLGHGIPSVATDLPSTREVLGDDGAAIYLRDDNTDAFVNSVLSLLDDPARYASAVTAAQKRARELTWDLRAQRLLTFTQGPPSQQPPLKTAGSRS
jgi:glycosyltransferase involved in cell wall biosynthesis